MYQLFQSRNESRWSEAEIPIHRILVSTQKISNLQHQKNIISTLF